MSRPALWSIQPPVRQVQMVFPMVKVVVGVTLATYFRLAPGLRMIAAMLLLPLYTFMVQTGHLLFTVRRELSYLRTDTFTSLFLVHLCVVYLTWLPVAHITASDGSMVSLIKNKMEI
jgi:hypothetical protein